MSPTIPTRSSRLRRTLATIAALAAATVTFAGCTPTSSEPPSGDAQQSTLRYAFSAEPPRPAVTAGAATTVSYQLYGLIHRGVMTYADDGNIVPGLAETAEQIDPLTYTFTLRDGLTYHDGTPVTVEDVKRTLLWYADPAHSARSYPGMKYIADISIDGDRDFTITLSSPNLSFLEYLADPCAFIVPEHELGTDVEAPIGAGPYELESWKEGVGLNLEKFDNYYAADDVKLDTIDVSFYADATARVNALLSGDVDFIDYVPWESYEQLESAGFVVDGEVSSFQSAFFNVVDGPFSDVRVRQAAAYAINRENATNAGFFGHGIPLYGLPGAGETGEQLWEYDPEKARDLLAEAGFEDGGPVIQILSNSTYAFLRDVAQSIQADLEAVGFTVEMSTPDWATFTQEASGGMYDLQVNGNIGNVADVVAWLPRLVQPPSEANKSFGYSNSKLDDALARALAAKDEATKEAALFEAYEIIQEDVPFVTVNQRVQSYGYSPAVSGFEVMPGFRQPYSVNNLVHVSVAG